MQEIVATLTVLLGGLTAFLIARGISGPLLKMGGAMKELASGNLEATIPAQDKRDEIGEMAKAVLVFQKAAVENARLEREAAEHSAQAESDRARNEQAQREAIEHERAVVASSIGSALSKLAAKDLTYRMPTDIPDAYRKLQVDFNAAIAQLEEAMRSVTGSAHAIHSGTQEISTASDDLSRRTEQQAASLEETAAALDEITATVKKSAEGASHARQVVAAADEDAKKSAVVVRQAVEAMDAIAKSSQQISQIIGVIDEIAFQTNLLALNAGVEAARAGDAGRGFAVVASEVRALAQRSAEAAKEIKGLISTSTTQVDHGVKLVAETGRSLERIMSQVTEINERRRRDRRGGAGAGHRPPAGQHGDQPDGSSDAAECDDGRGIDGRQPLAVAGDRSALRTRRAVPGRSSGRRGRLARPIAEGRAARLPSAGEGPGGREDGTARGGERPPQGGPAADARGVQSGRQRRSGRRRRRRLEGVLTRRAGGPLRPASARDAAPACTPAPAGRQ